MLVLTRKVGQKILIDHGLIQMKVLKANNGIISIGIQAPAHIDIDREEVFLRKLSQHNDAFSSIQER